MSELQPGDLAPDFAIPADGGTKLSLKDYSGKKVVLYFYPKADTPACTTEAIDFSALKSDFEKAGAVVIGVSPDPVKKHEKFAAKHNLTVALGSDESTDMAQSYGVWQEKSMYGKKYMGIARTTFLIGADGRILKTWAGVKVKGHAQEVLEAVKAAS
ncbi:peroxiredoxin Q/BCP [Ensifer adhaerens]|nr:peroxiredoxin Q/BCP [Ensifer adhaerens]HZG30996.1 thioredoxin-dependent thiol peroxidase [Ensifer sp.]